MSAAFNKQQMAEYIKRSSVIDDNKDIQPRIPSNGDIFHDVFLRGIEDFSNIDLNNDLPSNQMEKDMQVRSAKMRKRERFSYPGLQKSQEFTSKKELDPVSKGCAGADVSTTPSNELPTQYPLLPCNESLCFFLPENYNRRNPWRRTSGFYVAGQELRSATYPARSSVKKQRFAQAKKPLNYLYSYFSIHLEDCDDEPSIVIGLTRKDYSSKIAPGKAAGSVGYFSDTGCIFIRDTTQLNGLPFTKGDTIGCGIIYPTHYKRYADLSTDDNSDGMTDIVLTSLLNKRSMSFVCSVLNINVHNLSHNDSDGEDGITKGDYYNENFVESRTQVEVYFTYNMQVIGKIHTHIPIGGFYPTLHMLSTSAIKLSVDLIPPS